MVSDGINDAVALASADLGLAAIPLAAAGLLNSLILAAVMSLSSVLIVNSLRIQHVRSHR